MTVEEKMSTLLMLSNTMDNKKIIYEKLKQGKLGISSKN